MEITAHQAIFGENNNRHSTLYSSLNDKDLLDKLAFSTDRPLSTGHWLPYTSGYTIEKYYVLLRIAPDKRLLSTRGGWCIAHALIFHEHELSHWNNLMQLISLLPETPIRQETLSPLHLTENEIDNVATPLAFSQFVSLLVKSKRAKKTLVWVGNDGHLEAIHSLWRNLWVSARTDISFTSSYRPHDVDSHFTLVSTPIEYVDQWREYNVIKDSEIHQPSSNIERLLLGQGNIQELESFMHEADIKRVPLSKVGLIHQAYEYYTRPDWESSLQIVRPLARLMAEIAPDPESNINLKTKIITQLQSLTIHGTVDDILALRNFNVAAFRGSDSLLASTIKTWGTHYFASLQMKHASDISRLLEGRPSADRKYWNGSVNQILQSVLMTPSSWKNTTAGIIWKIWIEKPSLVTETASFFGNEPSVEGYLVSTCPPKIAAALGKVICVVAANRSWLRLHAAALAGYADIHIAFEQQIQIDTHPEYSDGIRELAMRYANAGSAQTMLELLMHTRDKRSSLVAGQLCAQYPSLLQTLDLSYPTSVDIWLKAIDYEEALLDSSAASSKVVYQLLDAWLSGKQVRRSILERIGRSQRSDLTEYPRRSETWGPLKRISYTLADSYLFSTAKGWLSRFKNGENRERVLEEPLANAIKQSSDFRELLASSTPGTIPIALHLFTRLRNHLGSWAFEDWFLEKQLQRKVTSEDAALVGKFIADNRWEWTAQKLARYIERNPTSNWIFTLDECQHLLSRQKFKTPKSTYNDPVQYQPGHTNIINDEVIRAVKIFYSYAPEDRLLRDELEKHLSTLQRQQKIEGWFDRNILAGSDRTLEIESQLNSADIILLLVSPDFTASDYCYGVEMIRAMERHKAGEARVIPIILRPVDWKGTPFALLHTLPTGAEPVTEWNSRDKAWLNVVEGIKKVVEDLRTI